MKLDKSNIRAYYDQELPDEQAHEMRHGFLFDADFRADWKRLAQDMEVPRQSVIQSFSKVLADEQVIFAGRVAAGEDVAVARRDFLTRMNDSCDAFQQIFRENADSPNADTGALERAHAIIEALRPDLSEFDTQADRGRPNSQQTDAPDPTQE